MKLKTKIILSSILIVSSVLLTSCMSLSVSGHGPFGPDFNAEISTYPNPNPNPNQNPNVNPNFPPADFESVLRNRTWHSQGPFSLPYADFYTNNHLLSINQGSRTLTIKKDYFVSNRFYRSLRIVYNYNVSGNWNNMTQVHLSNPQVYDATTGMHINMNSIPQNIRDKDIYKYNPVGFDFSYLPNAIAINDQDNSGIVYTYQ